MSALVFSPHQDDCALFTAFNAMRHQAHVVTVLRDGNGNAEEREAEDREAIHLLGCGLSQWAFMAGEPDPGWDEIALLMRRIDEVQKPPIVFAPWPEPHGHPEHNMIGKLALDSFGDRVTYYATYRFGGPRTTGTPSEPDPWMIPLKLRALACYESQMLRGPRRFFLHSLEEWTMP